jgi:hypothetical protein
MTIASSSGSSFVSCEDEICGTGYLGVPVAMSLTRARVQVACRAAAPAHLVSPRTLTLSHRELD